MYPENVTVPPAAAFMLVPVDAAMSNPVCLLTLLLLTWPNLDVIVPEIGLIKLKFNATFLFEIFVDVFTFPVDTGFFTSIIFYF